MVGKLEGPRKSKDHTLPQALQVAEGGALEPWSPVNANLPSWGSDIEQGERPGQPSTLARYHPTPCSLPHLVLCYHLEEMEYDLLPFI